MDFVRWKQRSSFAILLFFFSISNVCAQYINRGQSNSSDFDQFFQKGVESIKFNSDNYRISKVQTMVDLNIEEYRIKTKLNVVPIGEIKCDSIRITLPLLFHSFYENSEVEFEMRREGVGNYVIKVNGNRVLCKYDFLPTKIDKDNQLENCSAAFFVKSEEKLEIEIDFKVDYFSDLVYYYSGLKEYGERISHIGFIPNATHQIDTVEIFIDNNIPDVIPVYIDSAEIGRRKEIHFYNATTKENTLTEIRFNPDNYLVSKDFLKNSIKLNQLRLDSKWDLLFDKNPETFVEVEKNDVIELFNKDKRKIFETFVLLDKTSLSDNENGVVKIPVSIKTELYCPKNDTIYIETESLEIEFAAKEYNSKAYAHTLGYLTRYSFGRDRFVIYGFFRDEKKEPYEFVDPTINNISIQFHKSVRIAEVFLLEFQD